MSAPHSSAKAQEDDSLRPLQRGRNCVVPKSHCTNRSAWRVLPGKPPERLSPYYQLGCDFGSSLMLLSGRNDGCEPVYVCEEHAKELEHSADARAAAGNGSSELGENHETPAEAAPIAVPRQASSAAPENANGAPEARRKTAKPAGTPAERCATIDRLIGDLTTQLENIFSQAQAAISPADTIDTPLEQAALEVIGNPAMSETQKDAAVQQLGALQESLKHDAGQEMTPLVAHRIKETVRTCLSRDSSIVDEAKPGYRAAHDSLQKAIHAAVPKAKHIEERLANLLKMKAELENPPQAKELAPAVA
jgi:hypothetical protein